MLVIRNTQLHAIGNLLRIQFEDRVTAHFLSLYPRECEQAGGEANIRGLVRTGLERAGSLGFRTQRQAGLFVGLMFILGIDFDIDPQLPWLPAKLRPDGVRLASDRIQQTYDAAIDYLGVTAGEDCEHVVRAMLRIRKYDMSSLPASTGPYWECDMLEILHHIYPEKFDHQGVEANRRLVALGRERAESYDILGNEGEALLTTLMFMLGSGFDHDPLYPWAAESLKANDSASRRARLYREAIAHMNASLVSEVQAG